MSFSTEYSSQSLFKYQLEDNDLFFAPNSLTGYFFNATCLGLSVPRSLTPTYPTGSCGPNTAPVAVALDRLLVGSAPWPLQLQVLPGPGSGSTTELLATGSGSDCRPGSTPTITSGDVGVVSDLAEENVVGLFNHIRISMMMN